MSTVAGLYIEVQVVEGFTKCGWGTGPKGRTDPIKSTARIGVRCEGGGSILQGEVPINVLGVAWMKGVRRWLANRMLILGAKDGSPVTKKALGSFCGGEGSAVVG